MGLMLSLTLLGLLLLMCIALALSTDTFLTEKNITNLLRQGAMVAIIAVGQTFVIITAGIDLSVGAVVGFCSVAVAWLLVHGFSIGAAVVLTLLLLLALELHPLRVPPRRLERRPPSAILRARGELRQQRRRGLQHARILLDEPVEVPEQRVRRPQEVELVVAPLARGQRREEAAPAARGEQRGELHDISARR